jgi:hypothetical protein
MLNTQAPFLTPAACPRPSVTQRRRIRVAADLSGLGQHVRPDVFKIKQLIGQGSFGEVFEVWRPTVSDVPEANDACPLERRPQLCVIFRVRQHSFLVQGCYNHDGGGSERVIMKRVKSKVAVRRCFFRMPNSELYYPALRLREYFVFITNL